MLKDRLFRGEITKAEFDELSTMATAELTVKQIAQLAGTPSPRPQISGPSSGDETKLPNLVEVEFGPGDVVFDQWRITSEIGRGGFGAVFAAEDINLGSTMAVKILDRRMVENPDLLKRFRREVEVMRCGRGKPHPYERERQIPSSG